MLEKVNWFCDEYNSVWNVNYEGLEMSTSVPIVDLSSDNERIDLIVPLPPGCLYIRDSKTSLPCVWRQRENCGWIPNDSEIISSPTHPNRFRARRPASPFIGEPVVQIPVPVVEVLAPVDRALNRPPKDIRLVYTRKRKRGVQGEQPMQGDAHYGPSSGPKGVDSGYLQHVAATIAQQNANRNASVRMGTWSKVGDSAKKVGEAGEMFGDVEKKPFDGKRKSSGFPMNSLGFKRREIRILVRLMLQTRLVLLVGKPFAKDAENRVIKLRFTDLRCL
ncbi:hypothetical protein L1987_54494 [Smallanthus sonchifolius]|uniref:Uncharacterized protein n=1 Tax=Smallanthus sonchifolius TaxID=185202 RepID=A0ACB9E8C7_9ASTR|nr:hypothetical protein L1987_54494 [Smallanthus sonchifolius]